MTSHCLTQRPTSLSFPTLMSFSEIRRSSLSFSWRSWTVARMLTAASSIRSLSDFFLASSVSTWYITASWENYCILNTIVNHQNFISEYHKYYFNSHSSTKKASLGDVRAKEKKKAKPLSDMVSILLYTIDSYTNLIYYYSALYSILYYFSLYLYCLLYDAKKPAHLVSPREF